MPLDFMSAGQGSPAITTKFLGDDIYIVMVIDFGVIWASDFDNAFRFDIRLPANRQTLTSASILSLKYLSVCLIIVEK